MDDRDLLQRPALAHRLFALLAHLIGLIQKSVQQINTDGLKSWLRCLFGVCRIHFSPHMIGDEPYLPSGEHHHSGNPSDPFPKTRSVTSIDSPIRWKFINEFKILQE